MSNDTQKSKLFVESVSRAFSVLRAFEGNESLSLTEISRIAGITTAAAQRFTHTLEELGYLRKDQGRRWHLTPRCLEFGAIYTTTDALIGRATPHLVELNHTCKESVNLSRPDATDMVFVARFTSNERSFIQMPLGTRIPMFCGATGRAYLSRLPRDAAQDIVEKSLRTSFTARTITDPKKIMHEIDKARERGFASAAEEFYVGDLSIAAPVVGPDGSSMGCVNISGPTSRWTMERLEEEVVPHLVHTARAISTGGYS